MARLEQARPPTALPDTLPAAMMSGRQRLVLVAAGLGVLMPALDATAVSVALPSIQRDLGASFAVLQWVLTAYLLAAAAAVIPLGRLGDRLGHRRAFLAGLVLFGVASAACAVAPSSAALIAARLVQGAGAAAVFTLSVAVVRATFPPERLGWAVALVSLASALGVALGPLAGGFLSEAVSWRWIFAVNLPVVAAAYVVATRALPSQPSGLAPPIRPLLALGFMVAMAAVVLAIVEADGWGWNAPATLALLVGGIVAMAALLALDAGREEALVDLGLFRRPGFVGACLSAAVSYATVFSLLFLLSISFQSLHGDSPLVAGLKLLPYSIAFMLIAPWAGRVVDRAGSWVPMAVGFAVVALASISLVVVMGLPEWVALVVVGAYGVGEAGAMSGITPAALRELPERVAGAATAITVTSRYLGGALGVAVSGAIYQAVESGRADQLEQAAGPGFSPAERAEVQELLTGEPQAREHLAQLPDDVAAEVLAVAEDAYVAGVEAAMGFIAALALAAAVAMVLLVRPQRKRARG